MCAAVSFSNTVKTELCGSLRKPQQKRAFLTGAILACRRFSRGEIILQTECTELSAIFPALVQSAANIRFDTEYRTRTGKQPVWSFFLGEQESGKLCAALGIHPEQRVQALQAVEPRFFPQFAAGCLAAAGSLADPERRYHLEIVMPSAEFASAFAEKISQLLDGVNLKTVLRKGDTVLYLKQNVQICDFLAFCGATNASLALAEQTVYKDIRSQTNRRTNCDLANIDKTLTAGAQQVESIRRIQEKMGLESLPEPLREIAVLRLNDPEANLRDLGALCNPPISRSGVHHRLQRISELAAKL